MFSSFLHNLHTFWSKLFFPFNYVGVKVWVCRRYELPILMTDIFLLVTIVFGDICVLVTFVYWWHLCFYDNCDLVTFSFGDICFFETFLFWWHFCFYPSSIIYQPSSIIYNLIDCPSPLGQGWMSQTFLISNFDCNYRLQTTDYRLLQSFFICNPVEASLPGLPNK